MSEQTIPEDVPLTERIAENPRPALLWAAVMVVLVAVEFGALLAVVLEVLKAIVGIPPQILTAVFSEYVPLLGESGVQSVMEPVQGTVTYLDGLRESADTLPTLLSRDVIPNQGYYTPSNGWQETFLGLEPMWPWAIRTVLVFAYAFFLAYWVWRGYLVFRRHYRQAEWTPRDDIVKRLRGHRWGQFGFVIVFAFLTMAVFAPALGPTTVEANIREPCSNDFQYWDTRVQSVETISVCNANFNVASNGQGGNNVGLMQYDRYGRFHPFGTLPTPGKDMFTFMVAGARVSLFIGLLAIGLGGVVATAFAMITAYYKGLADLAVVIASDSIMTIPALLLLIIVSVTFRGHWLNSILSGGLLIALILAFTRWPLLWRAIRGPSFQVAEQEWVDAARSYGQRARVTMRKHMLPYVMGYLLIYGSMSLGGVIITTSALSFLPGGLGVQAPTPEWGRAIAMGQSYVATQSWHISMIPGILIVLVVTAFNALGDGIRDAIDPQSEGSDAGAEMGAGGGGG